MSDAFPPDGTFGSSDGEGEGRPAVFVTTRDPIPLSVRQLEDERAPEGSALGAYIDGRLVARSAMDPLAIARLIDLSLFEEPVPLGLFVYEEAPGLQCRLFALVPHSSLEGEEHEAEPWKASVPSYRAPSLDDDDQDDEDDDDDDDDDDDEGFESDDLEAIPFETILLGHIVRFEKDRKHPDDLAAEAVDILQRVIHGSESLLDADRKAIDDLLDSI